MNDTSLKQQKWLIIILLALCLVSFSNTFPNEFVWDDPFLISDNPYIKNYRNIPLFFTPYYWRHLHPLQNFQDQYRPLRTTTFAIDYFFWKLNPAGYHLTNLLLHMANVVLIFYLVAVLGRASRNNDRHTVVRNRLLWGLPFLTAAFFATHPIHTESVTYIKNRSDLLAFLFFMLSFLLFFSGRGTDRWGRRLLVMTGSLFSFILAMLSKEIVLTLPAVLVLYAFCFQDKAQRARTFIRVIPYCFLVLFYFWFRQAMFDNTGLTQDEFQVDAGRHLLAIIKTIGTYLALLACPVQLNAERPFSIPGSFLAPGVYLSLAALMIIVIITIRARHRSKTVVFAIFYLFVTLLPAANIIFLETRPIAEQRLYLPSFGFCLLLAWCFQHLYHCGMKGIRPKVTQIAACLLAVLLIGGYGGATIQRNRDWRDPLTFYARTLAGNSSSPRVHNNLGVELAKRGQHEAAITHFEAALRIFPSYARAHNNLGAELEETERIDEAIRHYERAIQLDPEYDSAYYNLATALLKKRFTEEAVSHFKSAVQINPYHFKAMNNLGLAYYASYRLEEAIECYLSALRIKPDYDSAINNLGAALVAGENIEEAINRIPADSLSAKQRAGVYNSIASIYLQHERVEQAKYFYRRALISDPACTDALYRLGLALMTEGAYQEAIGVFSRLLAINPRDQKARERYAYCLEMVAVESNR